MEKFILPSITRPSAAITFASTDISSCVTPSAKTRWAGDALCIEASSAKHEPKLISRDQLKLFWELHIIRMLEMLNEASEDKNLSKEV